MARQTRKDLVLGLLREHLDDWVNGSELCAPTIGGSEGLRRIRELREDGFPIVMRRHPDHRRAVRQYKLKSDQPGRVVRIDHARNVWVQGHYRTKENEVGFERWVPLPLVPGFRLQDERHGMAKELSSGGHQVDVRVMPDIGKTRWYWSVKFYAYHPKSPTPQKPPMERQTVTGVEPTLELAQQRALEAFRRGRPGEISGTNIEVGQ